MTKDNGSVTETQKSAYKGPAKIQHLLPVIATWVCGGFLHKNAVSLSHHFLC